MHGIIFVKLKKFIDIQIGKDFWKKIQEKVGLSNKLYTPVREYPDKDFFDLLTAASDITNQDIHELEERFGKFIVPHLLHLYRRQIRTDWSLLYLLAHTEDIIHTVVRLRNPDASPPKLKIAAVNANQVIFHYTSPRQLCSFGIGLIQGIAEAYDEEISIQHPSCMLCGDPECIIEITRTEDVNTAQSAHSESFQRIQTESADVAVQADCHSKVPIVIIGGGLTGIRAVRQLLRERPGCPIRVYCDEPWEPYNRVRLSELLAGDLDWDSLAAPLEVTTDDNLALLVNNRIQKIDPMNRLVTEQDGRRQLYSYLLIATGSRARSADTQGRQLSGIYTHRNIDDTQALLLEAAQGRNIVVAGGGILGIEVAFALKKNNPDIEITIVHRNISLMNRELGSEGGDCLLQQVKKAGIRVYLHSVIKEYIGNSHIEEVLLSDGTSLFCDTLVFCAGIIQNTELAQEAGLEVGRGIKVNQYMQTSDPYIYAAGECIEYNGKTYGTMAPCTDQAVIAVDNILHGNHRAYKDTNSSVRAKISHLPVFSLKNNQEIYANTNLTRLTFRHEQKVGFRQLILCRGRLIGAQVIGEWNEINIIQEAIDRRMRIWPWRRWYFLRYGGFSPDITANNINHLHQTAIVCCCNNITRAELNAAFSKGNKTVEDLSRHTGAGQNCGSCVPLLAQLTGVPEDAYKSISSSSGSIFFLFSLLAVLLPILIALPGIPVPQSVLESNTLSVLLQHRLFHRISGYMVLSFFLLTFVLSINKRFSLLTFFHYIRWRTIHVLAAASAGGVLLLHANFSMGKGFFLYMMLLFLAVTLTGLNLSTAIALERSFFSAVVRRYRGHLLTLHWMFVTFFFVYVVIHITASYYF